MNIRTSRTVTALLPADLLRSVVLVAFFCLVVPTGRAIAQSPNQETYDSSDAAVAAFTAAFESGDMDAIRRVLGGDLSTYTSGEAEQDKNEIARLAKAVKELVRPVNLTPKRVVLYLGAFNWPFPIPVVQSAAGKWHFDTAAGREEYLNRRVGRNELATMKVLRTCAEAQVEYAAEDRDGDGVIEYAQKILSTDGTKDGLFWPAAEGETPSPMGELIGRARDEGYGPAARSYMGYRYGLFTKQGPAAIGGAKEYIVDGNMVRGYALVAWPVSWGASGIMTFIIGPDGRVFEKNLGPKTSELAPALDAFNPDSSWKLSEE